MSSKVDEALYSRQLYVFGHEAQRKMAESSVLICGLNGLGVEVAKNIILAGVKSCAVWDNAAVSYEDLSSQFYFTENDIGKSKAVVSLPKLAELNPYVALSLLDHPKLTTDIVRSFSCVVLVNFIDLNLQMEIAEFCHSENIKIVIADTKGVFGNIFCDFGKNFSVIDSTGEPAASSMLAGITCDSPALVTVLEETRHGLESGDKVVLSDIVGMEELNGKEFTVTVKDLYSFEINCDTTMFSPYQQGGHCNQVKQPISVDFDSYRESYDNPGMFHCDFMKMDRAATMHVGFRALQHYVQRHGQLPEPGNRAHAQQLLDLALEINAASQGFKVEEEELRRYDKVVTRLAMCARGLLSPMCALLGGVVGQEVLKACSGKFMPIKQWFYLDAMETLPEDPLPADQVAPLGCRYDGQIMVYGRAMQQQLGELNMFLVGAGAIGCEMIKNWALMGVSTSEKASVHITDMDRIEKSNLSRQFLFRNADIGHQKSTTAAKAAIAINPAFKVISYEVKVAPETETLFNDSFFEGLDIVCTALDNVDARLYIDQRCLFYQKPMLESGTLGTKGHTQIVVPGKTEHYGATRDPPEKTIPMCTLKSFPNMIEHTLQWAREWFEEVFKQMPDDANSYLSSSDFAATMATQQNMKLDTLKRIKDALIDQKPSDFEHCIRWARLRFEDLFVNRINQLLFNFPADKLTSSGTLFWSGAKKAPSALCFDVSDPLHLEFVKSAASLFASMYNINVVDGDGVYLSTMHAMVIPEFRPADGVTISVTEEDAKNSAVQGSGNGNIADIDDQCSSILNSLTDQSKLSSSFSMCSIEFDKDLDDHMRVIAACSNLRARNYKIKEADLHTSRGIAGKITPAIATTTALVTGAICLEIYKLLQNKPADQYRNSFTNLALPLFTNMEPNPPKTTKSIVKGEELKWTPWDCIDINKPGMTLKQLLQYLGSEYGVEVCMLASGASILYSNFMNKKKMDERMDLTLKEVAESVTKKSISELQKYLVIEGNFNDIDTDEEVDLPYIRYCIY